MLFRSVDALVLGVLAAVVTRAAAAPPVAQFDFAKPEAAAEWKAIHDIARLRATSEGLRIEIGGGDPYVHGPARDYPTGQPLWLQIRLRASHAGAGQVFFFTADRPANEPDSVRFNVRGGTWEDVRVPVPPFGPGVHLRLDPPGGKGDVVTVALLDVEPRIGLKEPDWPRPEAPSFTADAPALRAGELELKHAPDRWGGFEVRVSGHKMACGFSRPLIGYVAGGTQHWIDVEHAAHVDVRKDGDSLAVRAAVEDADGATWALVQRFHADSDGGTIAVTSEVTVDQPREVVFLPMFLLLPGLGSYGETKHQAVFAGLEYLGENEPSSSEADIVGPGARRQVPDNLKITFPLMAIQAEGRYVGLVWQPDPRFCAVFDSPDRLFGSGAHVMGVLCPGSDGVRREEGQLLPYEGERLDAGETLTLRAILVGGRGESVVPAIQQYVRRCALPAVPMAGVDWTTYARTAAAGWLDSAIREQNRYRHAFPGNFGPQAAPDAAAMMDWLAGQVEDDALRGRLREAAREAVAAVRPGDLDFAGVSHVRYPLPGLVYGAAAENSERAEQVARERLSRFEPDGRVRYRRRGPDSPDYGRTHFAEDANGMTAQVVADLLEAASLNGDRELIKESLRRLHDLKRFDNTVPRGAQTWEVPLHTPDILAAAHLVRAYTRGYELTGDAELLERARYWAWTGVPFVYLVPPTEQPLGTYATIAVYGATNWVAPNWMGLPVQWCGLVYADALYRLSLYDPEGPWRTLADGITASGVQQTWPLGSDPKRQGLLPDSFALRAQVRNDAAINPGTLLVNAVRLFGRTPLYTFRAIPSAGVLIHAPGALEDVREEADGVSFVVDGWPEATHEVLILGIEPTPRVRVNGREIELSDQNRYDAADERLILTLEGRSRVRVGR